MYIALHFFLYIIVMQVRLNFLQTVPDGLLHTIKPSAVARNSSDVQNEGFKGPAPICVVMCCHLLGPTLASQRYSVMDSTFTPTKKRARRWSRQRHLRADCTRHGTSGMGQIQVCNGNGNGYEHDGGGGNNT